MASKDRTKLTAARTALEAARPTLGSNGLPKGAEPRLAAALSAWLQGATGVADDVARLEGNVPIVFFPVRVQTRFETRVVNNIQQRFLKIRVYPDEILINSHETALTPDEED